MRPDFGGANIVADELLDDVELLAMSVEDGIS